MAATAAQHSSEKKKKGKNEERGSSLFCGGGAQPENSIVRQQWRCKYLRKDQRWQSGRQEETMAARLDAAVCGGREKETRIFIISLLIGLILPADG